MRLARQLYDQLVEHARSEAPNECCGIVVMDGERRHVRRAREEHPREPAEFELDHADQIRLFREFGDLACIYHSHTRTAPEPSQTDVNFAANWPGVEWLIIGLKRRRAGPAARSASRTASYREVEVEVT